MSNNETRLTIWVVMRTEERKQPVPVVAFGRKRRADRVAEKLNGLNYDVITGHSVVSCSLVIEE